MNEGSEYATYSPVFFLNRREILLSNNLIQNNMNAQCSELRPGTSMAKEQAPRTLLAGKNQELQSTIMSYDQIEKGLALLNERLLGVCKRINPEDYILDQAKDFEKAPDNKELSPKPERRYDSGLVGTIDSHIIEAKAKFRTMDRAIGLAHQQLDYLQNNI